MKFILGFAIWVILVLLILAFFNGIPSDEDDDNE